jgi:ABC-type branched-subunit amino acid transport system ATPase component
MTAQEPKPDSRTFLQVQDLTKSFGGIRAVNHVNLNLSKGELRCLIGPNGAGKSTLFNLLSGLQRPEAGSILFKGEDITSLPPFRRVRKGVCQKFQTTRIYRGLTVNQNLMIARRAYHGLENGRLTWALKTLGSIVRPASCPTVISSGWRSVWRLPRNRISFSWMNLRPE